MSLSVPQAIEALSELGLSEKAIGAKVGASQPTINRIRHGTQKPSFDLGLKIIKLHETLQLAPASAPQPKEQAA